MLIPDDEKAEHWFRCSAESGYEWAEYALGKLLESQERKTEAAKWYDRAATQGNRYAQYRLAKLYLAGNGVLKNVRRAVELLEASTKQDNPYAAYTLGKLCFDGKLVRQNVALGMRYMEQAAQMGHAYAQFFLDHMNEQRKPALMLAVTRLLHCLGGIFESSRPLDATSRPIEIDRKRFAELQEKRIAMGHKPDDHEEQSYSGMSMATPW